MSKEIASDLLKSNLNYAIERIQESQQSITQGIDEDDIQSIYFGLFEDSIDSVGYMSFFKEPEEKIKKYLKIAAHSAIVLFQYQGKTTASYIELPELTTRTFIDYSVTNPWVYVRAIYAAAITHEINIIKGLLNIPTDILLKGQESIPNDLMNFLQYIPAIIHKPSLFADSSQKTFWSIQTNTLKSILEDSNINSQKEIENLKNGLLEYYSQPKYLLKPERFYLLPLNGIVCIKKIGSLL